MMTIASGAFVVVLLHELYDLVYAGPVKTLNRPGIDQVLEFMKENNYEGSRC